MQPSLDVRRRYPLRLPMALALLCGLVILAIVGELLTGPRSLTLIDLWQALTQYDGQNFNHRVIIDLRLLHLLAACLVGGALGIAGQLLQTLIRNPLGEPHILGLNAGAALAVVATTAFGSQWALIPPLRPMIAALGGGSLFLIVMAISSAGRSGLTLLKITLCGVTLSAFTSSLTAAILILDEQTLQSTLLWLTGDLSGLSWSALKAAVWPLGIALLLSIGVSPALNALMLGDAVAAGLGVNIRRIRFLAMVAIALLCGSAVALTGPIGFVGLIVPNIVRLLITRDQRYALPCCLLCGMLILLVADILARVLVAPHQLATGVMTAVAGAPLFIYLASRYLK